MNEGQDMARQAVGPGSLMAAGQACEATPRQDSGVLGNVADQINNATGGIHDAIGMVRRLTLQLRGPVPQNEQGPIAKEPAPESALHKLDNACGRQSVAVNNLHDALHELRDVLGL